MLIDFFDYYNTLVEGNYFTEEELNLLSCINGATVETLNDAVFARYGYRTVEDLINE